jgi:hypothetical protein
MGDRQRAPPPAQAVALELEAAQHRRPDTERIEGAEQVMLEARLDHLSAAHGAARLRLCLEHEHVPAGLGEHVRRRQAVRARADHDRLRGHGASAR